MVQIPATFVGSYPRPSWFTANHGRSDFLDVMHDSVYREQYLDAISTVIGDQERAGLDILSDGEMRNDLEIGGRSWLFYSLDRLDGVENMNSDDYERILNDWGAPFKEGTLLREVFGAYRMPVITSKIKQSIPYRYADMWKFSQNCTKKPVKFAAPSIHNNASLTENRYYDDEKDLFVDLIKINNAELKAVADAGCKQIQVDEPLIHILPAMTRMDKDRMEIYKDAFNAEIKDVKSEIWAHTCWGNPNQQSTFTIKPSYKDSLPHLLDLNADVLTFEMASSGGIDLPIFKEYPSKKKIAIGVVNHVNNQVETPESVANILVKAAKYIDPDKLIATSDCGFGREGMSRRIAFYKLKSLAEGVHLANKQLS